MPIPSLNIQQIVYKLLSMINFHGRKGEEATKTSVSASLHNDSVEKRFQSLQRITTNSEELR
ncbi:First ORF in transposon ISC1225 [Saccharolobus solfataricus P2]|uniref:First ORF in transposon ISC1225 n=2 Tax=Saccharolobus solfataricus TaxID=2287 RepID=Q97WP6_SACS2|nr:First ORF in transposon ISC1225 [Saccharolobus solfataricus P2]SAI85790.1 ORF1 in transposon ISC1225 [Saccharolobus solfataricus]